MSAPRRRAAALRQTPATRVVVTDGAMTAGPLRPERIGVHLPEEFQLHPEQSTDALVLHHPRTTHFNAGGRS
ncbi:hypothetical protein ACFWBB_21570 [Streptomyces sp. NPDC060000]|uniref:hypothetical protein n=1 Tax=Streptomyces sp. NPDC060000 TaxID=3347031 RepID=UPI0036CE47CA